LIYVGLSADVEKLGDIVARDDAVRWLVYVIFASVAFAVAQSATGFYLLSLHAVWAVLLAGMALAVAVAAWVAGWVLQVASAYRLRRLLTLMRETTGEGLFGVANTLCWWGSALTIVLIGVVLLFAAYT
jgi:Predicted membrane protein